MKTHPKISPQSSASSKAVCFHPARRAFLFAACLLLLATTARAQDPDIGVRSKVMDKDLQWGHKTAAPEAGGHSKTFAIVAIEEVKSAEKLVKPVNEDEILVRLYEELLANGFTKYAKGTKPDILLAVSYGRGEMRNPYLRGQGAVGGLSFSSSYTTAPFASGFTPRPTSEGMRNDSGAPAVTLSGAVEIGQSVIDAKTPGHEAKLQKAGFEKLFIRVTAFAYSKDPKARPKMLWKTVIVADDPDHRDLNAIAAEMLKAGAPYFDKDIKEPEIAFYRGVAVSRVSVGTPEVVK